MSGSTPFVGRRAELAVLHERLAAALRGEPAVVQVEGRPGIGKTALVDRFLAAAADEPSTGGRASRVLRVSGDETETLLAYGVVDQLARAAGPAGAPLSEPDGAVDGAPLDDPITVGTRILRVLDTLGRDGPLVLVLDDAHWADVPSLRAVAFALRRLVADQILAVLVTRDDAVPLLPESLRRLVTGHRGAALRLGGLGEDDLRELATALGVDHAARAARALHEVTGGSPLHARALLAELPGRQWARHGDDDAPVPAPRSFRATVADRCRGATPDTRALVEAVAVLGSGTELATAARLAGVSDPLAALDEAEKLELLLPLPQRRVTFPHPLIQAALHDGMGAARRAALHAAAAEAAEDEAGALRHRVAAAVGPDASLAADLVASARQEAGRHAWPAAAAHLVEAGRLEPDRARGRELLLRGVNWMLLTGDVARARTYADEVAGFPPGAQRDSVLGFLARARGDVQTAEALLADAWRRCVADPPRRDGPGGAAAVVVDLEVAATVALQNAVHRYGRLDGAGTVEWSRRALALTGPDTSTRHAAQTYLAYGLAYTGAAAAAYEAVRGAVPQRGDPPYAWLQPRSARGLLRLVDDELDGARADLASAAEGATALGVSATAAFCLAYLARAEYFAGAWDEAVVHAERAVAVTAEADLDFIAAMALAVAALVPAARGDRAAAEALVREADQRGGYERSVASVGLARARIAEARSDAEGVRVALEPLRALTFRDAVDEPGFWAWADLYAEALVALGREDEADAFLVPHEERAAARGRAAPIARLARARGRIEAAAGRPDAAGAAYDRALGAVDRVRLPFERARIELAAGAFWRRTGSRRRAVALLEAAGRRFAVLRAEPYSDRCDRELAASGLHPVPRADRHRAMTSQELVVARSVAAGRSNREVAAELVISVKTVEFHLRNVFAKLGVGSRRELPARLAAVDSGTDPP